MGRDAGGGEHVATDGEEAPLRLFLLDGFRVLRGDQPVLDAAWGRPVARTIVKLLAVDPKHRLHREEIEDRLWPDLDPGSAYGSFRKALSLARHALEPDLPPRAPSSYLHLTDEILSLDQQTVWVDVDQFVRLAREGLSGSDPDALEGALAIYRGDLLPEDRYEGWTAARHAELAALQVRLLERLAESLESAGDYRAAIDRLHSVLSREPDREDVHRRVMRLYLLAGSRHQALRHYELCRNVLKRELGAEPDPETERLHAEIRTGRGHDAVSGAEAGEKNSGGPASPPLPAVLRQQPREPLVARQRPLEILLGELFDGDEAARHIVLVSGEAGVGKTRLVTEVARAAWERGALILWGPSYDGEGQAPYGPFVEALDGYLQTLLEPDRQTVVAAYPEWAGLVPSLAPLVTWSLPALAPEGERTRLLAAAARLLAQLAAVRPVLLVLDDLYLADEASLHLLHYLARRRDAAQWLVVATYRDSDLEAESQFPHLVSELSRTGLSSRIEILRLGRRESDQLVTALLGDGAPDEAFLERIYELSRGNPLFLIELVRSRQGGGGQPGTPRDIPVPEQIQRIVEERVERLGTDVDRLLGLAAVIGMEFTFDLLAAGAREALGSSGDLAILDALDRALRARIFEERAGGYAFHHPLVREALVNRLSGQRRTWLHATVARVLETKRPDDVDALAYHWSRGGDRDRAVVYLERAGDRAAALHANEAADRHYREAIVALAERGLTRDLARLREKWGAVLATVARYDEALEALEPAVETYRSAHDLEGHGRVAAAIGRVHRARGTPEQGIVRVESGLSQFAGRVTSEAHATLLVVLSSLLHGMSRFEESVGPAQQAVAMAHALGNRRLLGEAQLRLGSAVGDLDDVEGALPILEQAAENAEAVEDLSTLAMALNVVGAAYLLLGRLHEAKQARLRGLEVAEKMGDPVRVVHILGALGPVLGPLGELQELRMHLERALGMLNQLPSARDAAYPLLGMGMLCTDEGRFDDATRYLERAVEIGTETGNPIAQRLGHWILARGELLRSQPQAALTRLQAVAARPELNEGDISPLLFYLTDAYLQLGDGVRAEESARRALEIVEGYAYQGPILLDGLLRGAKVDAYLGRWQQAEGLFREIVERSQAMDYRAGEAEALYAWGCSCAARGVTAASREKLEAALALAESMNAAELADRVRSALARLDRHLTSRGVPPSPANVSS